MAVALIAALGITAGAGIYNARTERQLLNAQKQMLDAVKSSGMGNNVQQKGQGDSTPGQNQTSILKQIEQHLANIDAIYEQKEKIDEQDTARFQKYYKARQLPVGTGKGYGPNAIH